MCNPHDIFPDMTTRERYSVFAFIFALATANLVNFSISARRADTAADDPVSTNKIDQVDLFPSTGILFCLPPFNPVFGPWAKSVNCSGQVQTTVIPNSACGEPFNLRVRVITNGQEVVLDRPCYAVMLPPLDRLTSVDSSFLISIKLNYTVTSVFDANVIAVAFDPAVSHEGDVHRLPPSGMVSAGRLFFAQISATVFDRTSVGGTETVTHALSVQELKAPASLNHSLTPAFAVTAPDEVRMLVYPGLSPNYDIQRVKFYVDYSWLDVVSAVAALVSLSISIFSFWFPSTPFAKETRLFRFSELRQKIADGSLQSSDGKLLEVDVPMAVPVGVGDTMASTSRSSTAAFNDQLRKLRQDTEK